MFIYIHPLLYSYTYTRSYAHTRAHTHIHTHTHRPFQNSEEARTIYKIFIHFKFINYFESPLRPFLKYVEASSRSLLKHFEASLGPLNRATWTEQRPGPSGPHGLPSGGPCIHIQTFGWYSIVRYCTTAIRQCMTFVRYRTILYPTRKYPCVCILNLCTMTVITADTHDMASDMSSDMTWRLSGLEGTLYEGSAWNKVGTRYRVRNRE